MAVAFLGMGTCRESQCDAGRLLGGRGLLAHKRFGINVASPRRAKHLAVNWAVSHTQEGPLRRVDRQLHNPQTDASALDKLWKTCSAGGATLWLSASTRGKPFAQNEYLPPGRPSPACSSRFRSLQDCRSSRTADPEARHPAFGFLGSWPNLA